jgi:hypothetical protein
MSERLSATDLIALIRRVFSPTADDARLGILVDLPDGRVADRPEWKERRRMAADWAGQLQQHRDALGLDVSLVLYRNVGMGNADLPAQVWIGSPQSLPDTADALVPAAAVPLEQVLGSHSLLLAPTEFSATAPLKLMAKKHRFRAATMPGFTADDRLRSGRPGRSHAGPRPAAPQGARLGRDPRDAGHRGEPAVGRGLHRALRG